MRRDFLRIGWVSAGVIALAAVSACGGKVVVDGIDGEGGAGGAGGAGVGAGTPTSTGQTTTTTTGTVTPAGSSVTTTGTGPGVCSCEEFCAIITECGAPPDQCQNICDDVPPDILACVCMIGPNCQALQQCGGGGTGGGGNVPPECGQCADKMTQQGPCAQMANNCANNPACEKILECHQGCGYGPDCTFCDKGPPGAVNAFENLVQCAICNECFDACAPHPIVNYCFDDGNP